MSHHQSDRSTKEKTGAGGLVRRCLSTFSTSLDTVVVDGTGKKTRATWNNNSIMAHLSDTQTKPTFQEEVVKAMPVRRTSDKSESTEKLSECSESDHEMEQTSGKNDFGTVESLLQWTGAIVWPLMSTVPLLLSSPYSFTSYKNIFPESWYDYDATSTGRPKPLGLSLGILAVIVGQIWVWIFFYLFKYGYLSLSKEPRSVQTKGGPKYEFLEGLLTHIGQPEGFVLLGGYLTLTWMFNLMPKSYYSFEGTIQPKELLMCLVIQDGIQYTMHLLEHVISPAFYKLSHKPHHRFTNPRLFDAFNGSLIDTLCMITIPLYITANIVHCNVWTYMSFGSTYACWLTLIHSEYVYPWDSLFRMLGLGTPADHHVHHKFFKFNYGHLFMWFDQLGGTYRDPRSFAPRVFRYDV